MTVVATGFHGHVLPIHPRHFEREGEEASAEEGAAAAGAGVAAAAELATSTGRGDPGEQASEGESAGDGGEDELEVPPFLRDLE